MLALALSPITTLAQTKSVAIPAIAFNGDGIAYNDTGTAAFFRDQAFAPVHLPDGATVTGFRCGARVTLIEKGITIKLRRNEPQQANVDMGMVEIPRSGDGNFKFLRDDSLIEPVIDNQIFNYYLIAEVIPKSENTGDTCNVNGAPNACIVAACNVDFTPPQLGVDPTMGGAPDTLENPNEPAN